MHLGPRNSSEARLSPHSRSHECRSRHAIIAEAVWIAVPLTTAVPASGATDSGVSALVEPPRGR